MPNGLATQSKQACKVLSTTVTEATSYEGQFEFTAIETTATTPSNGENDYAIRTSVGIVLFVVFDVCAYAATYRMSIAYKVIELRSR